MATYDTTSGFSSPPTWVRILLGVVLILAGLFVLGDVTLATLVSTMFIAAMAIVAGAFEIIHAFWTKGWGGFLLADPARRPLHRVRRRALEPACLRRDDPSLSRWD